MAGLDRDDDTSSLLLHASAVRLWDKGILLLGRSGSGKSDLALRLIDAGATLIADDQVRLFRSGGQLLAQAPEQLLGLIEIRGIGIMRLPHTSGALDLAVDFEEADQQDRLPEPDKTGWHGIDLPKITIDPHASSAVARIKTVLRSERVA